MNPNDLDQIYALLSQSMTRVAAPARELFLARLALLLIAGSEDPAEVARAIADAEADVPAG